MSQYVAMLRGIGPGNPNMTGTKFKAFFEALGFNDVQAVLASGNIIFECPVINTDTLAKRIEKELPQKLGFSRSVIIRSEVELQKLINLDPFMGIEHDHNKGRYLLITFFRHKLTVPFEFPYSQKNKPFTLLGRKDNAVYGTIDLTQSRTPDYMSWLEKLFGKEITSRTPKTIRLILLRMQKT